MVSSKALERCELLCCLLTPGQARGGREGNSLLLFLPVGGGGISEQHQPSSMHASSPWFILRRWHGEKGIPPFPHQAPGEGRMGGWQMLQGELLPEKVKNRKSSVIFR